MEKKPRRSITTTISAESEELIKTLPEPLSKFLDHAIPNELSRTAYLTSNMAKAIEECFRAVVQEAVEKAVAEELKKRGL